MQATFDAKPLPVSTDDDDDNGPSWLRKAGERLAATAAGEDGPATPAGGEPVDRSWLWSPGYVPSKREIEEACVGGAGTCKAPLDTSTPVRRGGSNHVACPTLCYLYVRAAQATRMPPSPSASPLKARRLPPCPSPASLLRQCHARAVWQKNSPNDISTPSQGLQTPVVAGRPTAKEECAATTLPSAARALSCRRTLAAAKRSARAAW